jgi:hypothetical protein
MMIVPEMGTEERNNWKAHAMGTNKYKFTQALPNPNIS